jgi:hypothetical protein
MLTNVNPAAAPLASAGLADGSVSPVPSVADGKVPAIAWAIGHVATDRTESTPPGVIAVALMSINMRAPLVP